MSNASHHHLPSLSSYRAIQPSSKHFIIECEPHSIYIPSQYPLQQGQDLSHQRSLSDPTETLSWAHPPLGAKQPEPSSSPYDRHVQHSQQLQPGKSAQPSPSPSPSQRNSTGSPYRAPTQPSQSTKTLQTESATPSIILQVDTDGPTHSRPAQPPRSRQHSRSASPSQPTPPQPNPVRPSHSKHAYPVYPEQSQQPSYPTPTILHQPNPIHVFPSKPAEPIYPEQSMQPSYPPPSILHQSNPIHVSPSKLAQPVYAKQVPKPTYSTPSTSNQTNPTHAFPSRPAQPPHQTSYPQSGAPTAPDVQTNPSITRLSSAPQVLVSTAEHPIEEEAIPQQKRSKFAGFVAATQKNAATRIATRVVAKTAFGALSNVVGADIGGAIDVAGGMNLLGSGIDAGNLVGNAVTSAANSAFDEAMGEDDCANHGGNRWNNLKSKGARFGGGGGGGIFKQ